MFTSLVLTCALLIPSAQATFDDQSDDDFSLYLEYHGNLMETYGATAAKGCLTGGITGASGGLGAACIGCVTGAAGNVAQDIIFNEKADRALEEGDRKRRGL